VTIEVSPGRENLTSYEREVFYKAAVEQIYAEYFRRKDPRPAPTWPNAGKPPRGYKCMGRQLSGGLELLPIDITIVSTRRQKEQDAGVTYAEHRTYAFEKLTSLRRTYRVTDDKDKEELRHMTFAPTRF
jgi:hypothetical protein